MRELLTNDSFIDLIYQNCLTTKLLASLKIELNEIRRLDKWPVKVLLQTWNPDVGFSKDRNWSRACNEIPPTTSIRLDLPVHTNFHSARSKRLSRIFENCRLGSTPGGSNLDSRLSVTQARIFANLECPSRNEFIERVIWKRGPLSRARLYRGSLKRHRR